MLLSSKSVRSFVDDQPLVPLCWQQEMKKGDIGYLLSETDLGDINIRGKYVPTGDAELYQEAVQAFWQIHNN